MEYPKSGYMLVNGYAKPFPFVYRDNIVVDPIEAKSAQKTTNHLKDIEYPPYKGLHWIMSESKYAFIGTMPDPMDWFFLNQAKRLMLEGMKLLKFNLIFSPRKIKYLEKVIRSFNTVTLQGMEHLFLEDEYLSPVAYELKIGIRSFLLSIGISMEASTALSDIFCHLIEYDNAYRWRLQDILSETDEQKLSESPLKEVWRLIELAKDRDLPGMRNKFNLIKYLSIILVLPKYRKAFKKMVNDMDFDGLKYSDDDRGWASQRTDYKSFGMSLEDRKKMYE